MESGYGDAADSDDTNSDCSDGDDLQQFVPALRENIITDVHSVQHAVEKYAATAAAEAEAAQTEAAADERGEHARQRAGPVQKIFATRGDERENSSARPRMRRRRVMTKYEYVRLRSMRISQLANGSPPLVQSVLARNEVAGEEGAQPELSMLERVFEEEVYQKRLPYIIRRSYADGRVDYIRASELDCERWLRNDA